MNDCLSKPLSLPALAQALVNFATATTPAPLEAPPQSAVVVDPIVLRRLKATLDLGGAAVVAGLLDKFMEQTASLPVALRERLAAGDAAQLRLIAHSAKSNGAMFGMSRAACTLSPLGFASPPPHFVSATGRRRRSPEGGC